MLKNLFVVVFQKHLSVDNIVLVKTPNPPYKEFKKVVVYSSNAVLA